MLKRTFLNVVAAAGVSLAAPTVAIAQVAPTKATPDPEGTAITNTAPQTGYAPVNGLDMYYEIHGSGEPLILLHGGLATTDVPFGPLIPHSRRPGG